jgi:hypothetical protein
MLISLDSWKRAVETRKPLAGARAEHALIMRPYGREPGCARNERFDEAIRNSPRRNSGSLRRTPREPFKNDLRTMSKASKIKSFDPNSPGDANAQMYGLPFTCAEADIVLVPVPWEVTTSYGGGTSKGPEAIFDASFQVDLFHPEFPDLWKRGIAMDEIPEGLAPAKRCLKKQAKKVIDLLTEGGTKKEALRTRRKP